MSITHSVVSAGIDDPGYEVSKDAWNDDHDVADESLVAAKIGFTATDRLLGRDTAAAGPGEELTPAAVRTMLGIERGTSFPGSPATNDIYYRTDRHLEYFYDGTRWLTTTLYTSQFGNPEAFQPISVTNINYRAPLPHPTYAFWIVDLWASTYVVTTNDGSRYWTITLAGPGTVLSTISNAANAVVIETASVGALGPTDWLQINYAKVSTPGNLYGPAGISYRLVG